MKTIILGLDRTDTQKENSPGEGPSIRDPVPLLFTNHTWLSPAVCCLLPSVYFPSNMKRAPCFRPMCLSLVKILFILLFTYLFGTRVSLWCSAT